MFDMRKKPVISGEVYHVYSRGNHKEDIFFDESDRRRFFFLLLALQGKQTTEQVLPYLQFFTARGFKEPRAKDDLKLGPPYSLDQNDLTEKVNSERLVRVINATLMENHIHATVYNNSEHGLPRYMQRLILAHTKYMNKKYERTGHVFESTYQAVPVKDDEQMLYLSAYIHRNQRDIKEWYDKEDLYPWSTYQDYITKNRWGKLLSLETVMDHFKDSKDYKRYVDGSGAKEKKRVDSNLDPNLDDTEFLIDCQTLDPNT